jgi:hypothetical protein
MKKFLLATIFVLTSIFAFSQTFTSSITGNWTTGSTWVGGTAPVLASGQLNNNVVISTGKTVTLSGNLTVKNGITLTVRGKLIVNALDFQNGSTIIVESGGILQATSLTNSNNSTNVTINGSLTVSGNFTANPGSELDGTGTMNVSGAISGTGTSFGQVLSCNNCTAMTGGIIDVIIDGNTQNIDIPIDCYYRYNYTEQIYYKSEINKDGNITSLSFEYDGYESFTETVKIYLGHTTKTQFSSSTDWVKSTNMTLVYDGNYVLSNTVGWYTINFTTPFYYNNIDNLVIGVHDYGSGYRSSSADFYSASTSTNYRSIYFDSDTQNPNPASPPTAIGTINYVPSLRLEIEQPPVALPIELLYFKGSVYNSDNILHWSTASEDNNDYFTIEKTKDGIDWEVVDREPGAGNSSNQLYYSSVDENVESIINYYRLKQTDYDGKFKYSDIISIDNRNNREIKEVVKITNILGQEVDLQYYRGLIIIYYTDGSSNKMIK